MISSYSLKRIACSAIASAVLAGTSAACPSAVAAPMDAATCAVGSYGLKKLIQKASAIKVAGLFEAVALAIVGDQCKSFVTDLANNKPATIDLHTNENQTIRQQIVFDDLVAPSLPAPPPPSGPGSLTATINQVQYRSEQCQGYSVHAFYDACMRGVIEPVYQ